VLDGDSIREALLWAKGLIIGGLAGALGYLYQVVMRGVELRWPVALLYVATSIGIGWSIQDAWALTADDVTGKQWPGMGAAIAFVASSPVVVYAAVQDSMPALVTRVIEWLGSKLK